jgi:hypothetical protein
MKGLFLEIVYGEDAYFLVVLENRIQLTGFYCNKKTALQQKRSLQAICKNHGFSIPFS